MSFLSVLVGEFFAALFPLIPRVDELNKRAEPELSKFTSTAFDAEFSKCCAGHRCGAQ